MVCAYVWTGVVIPVSITVSVRLTNDQEDRIGENIFDICELYA